MNKSKIYFIKHPLIEHYVTLLRDKNTNAKNFRIALKNLTKLMVFHVTEKLQTKKIFIQTPLIQTQGETFEDTVILLPILRAGWGMIEPFEEIIPNIKIGQIGYFRHPTNFNATKYYFKLPKINSKDILLLIDPMLATGGTIISALKELKKTTTNTIYVVTIFAAPEGIEAVQKLFPDICFYLVKIDQKLNEEKYIVPGLGDAGDRFFNTK